MFDISIIPIELCSQVDSTMVDPKEPLVFPPINHENLQILSLDSDQHVPHSPPSPQPVNSHLRGWIGMGFHILRSKISSLRKRGAIWSIGVSAAALLMSCWIIGTIRKKRTLTPNEARLINIIKDKDGKIAQLLHQIAEMNKILIDRHKALAAKVGD
ncbi:uncharacterized protein LOC109809204 [Cajanus cajan]|uniref:Transmembrane protein n=1 Tax=Cajanus cajan TaxID=3821 RepID=A0A151SL59_CAJCA|nr:uncharacterized protein LOC109809204 [Cajanus cajan]KYP55481.1 hypothetical protein KK1_001693 [Cajanus cajan]